jgi:hypothetical protein
MGFPRDTVSIWRTSLNVLCHPDVGSNLPTLLDYVYAWNFLLFTYVSRESAEGNLGYLLQQ